MFRRIASAVVVGGLLAPVAQAQDPVPAAPATATPEAPRRSIVHHNPLPYRPTSYHSYYPHEGSASSGVRTAGYSNPGGVGTHAEFYSSNTPRGQVDAHPVQGARFDTGGGPNRQEQIEAFQVGQQRAANIQNHIDAYGRPYGAIYGGFGYGLGLAGGRLYNFPY